MDLQRDESYLTIVLGGQKFAGRKEILQKLMVRKKSLTSAGLLSYHVLQELPTGISNLQPKIVECHPTGPDMKSVLILLIGTAQVGQTPLILKHTFVLTKTDEHYWVANMIQHWDH
jgi:hypothetical protein